MKKNLLFVFTMLCALSLFTGCSDNDDDKKKDVPFEKETLSFDGNELKLTYSKAAMLGKEVTFLTNDGQTATITLLGGDLDITGLMSMMGSKASPLESLTPGVIPGQTSTVISNVALTQVGDTYTFEGKTEVGGADILYSGNVAKEMMELDLSVTMPTTNLLGTWDLAPIVPGSIGEANVSQPVCNVWTSSVPFKLDLFGTGTTTDLQPGDLLTLMLNAFPMKDGKNAQQLMGALLKDVTFCVDGNIIANYSSKNNISNPVWEQSPANIAQYYVKDNQLYLVLNPEMILASITKSATKADLPLDALMPLLMQFLPMLSTGFPLSYTIDGEKLTVALSPALATSLLTAASTILSNETFMAELLKDLQENPAMKPYLPMITGLMQQFPEVVKGTTNIQLGLNFVK